VPMKFASFGQAVRVAAITLAIAIGGVTSASADIAGNIALATDYRFRGISQTDRDPAVSGGFDFTAENGIYAGVWGSNIAFGGSLELDYYGGYRGKITEELGYDVGYIYYSYPSDDSDTDLNYGELYGSLTFGGLKGGVNYSSNYFGETGSYWYLYGQYSHDIIEKVSASASVGYNSFNSSEDMASFLATEIDPGDNYLDWKVSVSTAWQGLTWSLAYVDTNLSKEDCGGADICEATAVFSISKSL
jgi:uncharacterized protein (TIGR02001 family)